MMRNLSVRKVDSVIEVNFTSSCDRVSIHVDKDTLQTYVRVNNGVVYTDFDKESVEQPDRTIKHID